MNIAGKQPPDSAKCNSPTPNWYYNMIRLFAGSDAGGARGGDLQPHRLSETQWSRSGSRSRRTGRCARWLRWRSAKRGSLTIVVHLRNVKCRERRDSNPRPPAGRHAALHSLIGWRVPLVRRADSGITDAWATATAMATRRTSEPCISGRSLSRDRSLAKYNRLSVQAR